LSEDDDDVYLQKLKQSLPIIHKNDKITKDGSWGEKKSYYLDEELDEDEDLELENEIAKGIQKDQFQHLQNNDFLIDAFENIMNKTQISNPEIKHDKDNNDIVEKIGEYKFNSYDLISNFKKEFELTVLNDDSSNDEKLVRFAKLANMAFIITLKLNMNGDFDSIVKKVEQRISVFDEFDDLEGSIDNGMGSSLSGNEDDVLGVSVEGSIDDEHSIEGSVDEEHSIEGSIADEHSIEGSIADEHSIEGSIADDGIERPNDDLDTAEEDNPNDPLTTNNSKNNSQELKLPDFSYKPFDIKSKKRKQINKVDLPPVENVEDEYQDLDASDNDVNNDLENLENYELYSKLKEGKSKKPKNENDTFELDPNS
jgi:hypothetical protein